MSQKSRFKMQQMGITTYRKTFPQLPGGTLENPKFIQTAHGYIYYYLTEIKANISLQQPLAC